MNPCDRFPCVDPRPRRTRTKIFPASDPRRRWRTVLVLRILVRRHPRAHGSPNPPAHHSLVPKRPYGAPPAHLGDRNAPIVRGHSAQRRMTASDDARPRTERLWRCPEHRFRARLSRLSCETISLWGIQAKIGLGDAMRATTPRVTSGGAGDCRSVLLISTMFPFRVPLWIPGRRVASRFRPV